MFETAAGDSQHDRAISALNYAFGMQFGELFQGLFMALESAPQTPPSMMRRLMAEFAMVPYVDLNAAVRRFGVGLDNLLTVYACARAAIDNKIQGDSHDNQP